MREKYLYRSVPVKAGERRQSETAIQEKAGKAPGKKLYLESYGCQMNFSDSEIVASILCEAGFATTNDLREADLIFVNTCAIRDNAEQRVRNRLREFDVLKRKKPGMIVGVLGCMAERLKEKLLEEEKLVDLVAGPDAYRDIPNLVREVQAGQKAVNVLLSREETYADISPVRLDSNGVTAFLSIMRGCDNMCSFCVVPFTRGRERSRNPDSIAGEARILSERGYREVTLLGQNVDSYRWAGGGLKKEIPDDMPAEDKVNFAQLLDRVAQVDPELRVRFSTSHPKDITDDVLHVMAAHENICKYIHLPAQSGSSAVLERMNRGYTRDWYMGKIETIRRILPDCGISTDIISGFCSETSDEHRETLSLMEWVGYDYAYMFKYSERPGTLAAKQYADDVPDGVKTDRLQEIIALQQTLSAESNRKDIGKAFRVLAEGASKRSDDHIYGRNSANKVVMFPKENFVAGDYAEVLITGCTSATLIGKAVA